MYATTHYAARRSSPGRPSALNTLELRGITDALGHAAVVDRKASTRERVLIGAIGVGALAGIVALIASIPGV